MGIALCGRRLGMAQELANYRQSQPHTGADRGMGVPEIVYPDVLKPGALGDGRLERWLRPEGAEARSEAVPADAAPDAELANSMSEIAREFRARTSRLLARAGPEPGCLEEELGRIVALVESGRNVALLKSLWGWTGADRRTLAAVAEDHGVVRERIRQISARAIQRIRKHELDTPYLRAAIEQLGKEKPSDQRLTTRLRDHAIARGPFSIRGLNLAARLLGVEGGPIPILKKRRRVAFGMVDRGQPARRL